MRTVIVLAAVLLATFGMTQSALAQKSIRDLAFSFIREREPFSGIILPDLNTGEPRSITEFRGKKVLPPACTSSSPPTA